MYILQVFVPSLKEADDDFSLEHTGPVRLAYIVITLTLGWPMYLVANVSGRPYDRWANHFDPYSPIFSKRERVEVCFPFPSTANHPETCSRTCMRSLIWSLKGLRTAAVNKKILHRSACSHHD